MINTPSFKEEREELAKIDYMQYIPRTEKNKSEISFMDFSNFEMAWKTAEMLSKARCIPKEFWDNPADVLVIVQFGHELGLTPMASLQNMMIVNNRPSIYGDAMLAVCMRTKGQSSGFIDLIEVYDESKYEWSCTAIRDGRQDITRTFTLEEAKLGGLLNKPGAWQTNRKRMMQFRPRSFALRDMFPDILKGIPTVEEMKDIPFEKQNNLEIKNTVDSMKERLKNKLSPIPLTFSEPSNIKVNLSLDNNGKENA